MEPIQVYVKLLIVLYDIDKQYKSTLYTAATAQLYKLP